MKKWVVLADVLLITIIIAGFFFWDDVISNFSACPLHAMTGGYCAGCGTTRMFLAIRHGHFLRAFGYNPFIFSLLVYLIIALVLSHFSLLCKKNVHKWLLNSKMLWFWAIASIVFVIGRNIPLVPFSYLAP